MAASSTRTDFLVNRFAPANSPTTERVYAHMIRMSSTVATPSVNAKPRTGPTARKYRTSAAARVTVLPARSVSYTHLTLPTIYSV